MTCSSAEMGSGASIVQCLASYVSTRVTRTSSSSLSEVPGDAPMSLSMASSAASYSNSFLIFAMIRTPRRVEYPH